MDWAFKALNVHRIVAFFHAGNSASVWVMEKLNAPRWQVAGDKVVK
jgi:RimJ/RimL family protein N-acetyltransferase